MEAPCPAEEAPLVLAARRVAEEVLAPRAEETDQAGLVPRSNLEALADAGLFGLACPGPGGARPSPATTRAVQEALAGACGATYFVWAQHHSPVRLLAAGDNEGLRRRWLDRLCRGEALAGVAFAYLRRPGPPAVSAERAPGGWVVRGQAPFVTSWGLADVFVVVAEGPGQELVWFCLEGRSTKTVRPSPPLALAVLQATGTVALSLDAVFVPDEDVVAVEPRARWRERDRLATAQPSPAALGLAQRGCALLGARAAELAEGKAGAARRGGGPVGRAAADLAAELARCRDHAYGLADALPGSPPALPVDTAGPAGPANPANPANPASPASSELDGHLAAMVEARAWGLDLAQRASLALVAAVGGRAMARSHPAQRLVREAAFYAVQAQTASLRAATMARLAAPASAV